MLAKISDEGEKANCFLSCFNDLLGFYLLISGGIFEPNNE
ncbi:hypothetical protein AALB_3673 [Agarivorans albus MKT 106]|uniref:Uncharacterized protein n=1 Tax=Agarivorans albus MKT 106 TaxID=1331007 RepID=R9PQN2_AGAAL|nr:hypothetical protein AALB_3673 [Agarivorans albus MKT 106]